MSRHEASCLQAIGWSWRLQVGMQNAKNASGDVVSLPDYRLLSLDIMTGAIKDSRDCMDIGVPRLFATADGHVIAAGQKVFRLTPDLKEDGVFDFQADGHRFGKVESVSRTALA